MLLKDSNIVQSTLIALNPKLSKLWIGLVFFIFVTGIVMAVRWHNYLCLLFILIYAGVFIVYQTNYKIHIYPSANKITVKHHHKHYQHPAQLIKFRHLGFLLTIITLYYNKQTISHLIFIDSVSLTQYKKLRMFLAWS
ncbi:MAG: hypothetical protein QG673_1568 [Pseudomonadota bacterium]|nr:hypothetical protein [Pseudomonadota bacterium]